MTRKQALQRASQLLDSLPETKEIIEVRVKLQKIIEGFPITNWTEETIFDTLDQFVIDHGRVPTVTDLKVKGMPGHPVIANRFKMTAGEFLAFHYPKSCHLTRYCHLSKEEWRQYFIDNLLALNNQTSDSYNDNRDPNTPCWQTIALMFGYERWGAWVEFCGIEPKMCRARPEKIKKPCTLRIRMDSKLFGIAEVNAQV